MSDNPTQLLIWGDDGFEECQPSPAPAPKKNSQRPKTKASPRATDALLFPEPSSPQRQCTPSPRIESVGESAFGEIDSPFGDVTATFLFEKDGATIGEPFETPTPSQPQARKKKIGSHRAHESTFEPTHDTAHEAPFALGDSWLGVPTPTRLRPTVADKISRLEADEEVARLLAKAGKTAKQRATPQPVFEENSAAKEWGLDPDENEDVESDVSLVESEDLESYDFPPVEPEDYTPRKKKPARPMSLMGRALAKIERQECSRRDLTQYLRKFDDDTYTPEAIEETLNQLEEWGYLDDERFAETRVQMRRRQWGNYRIRQELREHGISETIIDQVLAGFEVPEIVRCHDVWRRRFGRHSKDRQEQERQIRYLSTRGFTLSTILNVVRDTETFRMEIENWDNSPDSVPM